MKYTIQLASRPRTLANCPAGLFVFNGALCFKSEYGEDAYIVSSGEYFWGGTSQRAQRARLKVTPMQVLEVNP